MPKYYDFMICGYYLYFTSYCIVEAMHVHASDRRLTESGFAKLLIKVYPSCSSSSIQGTPFSFYLSHPQAFFNNSLLLSEEKRIFAEEKLHSAICEQAYIALVCIFYAAHRCPYLKFMAHVPLF